MKNKSSKQRSNSSLSLPAKIIIALLSIIFAGVVLTVASIYGTMFKICNDAKGEYQSPKCSTALIALLNDDNQSFYAKNYAIWTIGRMRSSEALPTLQAFYTGIIPEREPYELGISQYEIKKALLRIDNNIDVSPKREATIKEKLMDCMPKSDMESKQICDQLIKSITSFQGCSEAGFPVQESFPEQCRLPDGRLFINK